MLGYLTCNQKFDVSFLLWDERSLILLIFTFTKPHEKWRVPTFILLISFILILIIAPFDLSSDIKKGFIGASFLNQFCISIDNLKYLFGFFTVWCQRDFLRFLIPFLKAPHQVWCELWLVFWILFSDSLDFNDIGIIEIIFTVFCVHSGNMGKFDIFANA